MNGVRRNFASYVDNMSGVSFDFEIRNPEGSLFIRNWVGPIGSKVDETSKIIFKFKCKRSE